jgi:diaminopimelate decarboxylase
MKISKNVFDYLYKHSLNKNTPAYIYNTQKIRECCRRFTSIRYEPKSIHFATMANIHPEFLKIMHEEGLGVFVNSPEHLKTVCKAGFSGKEIVFTASALCSETMKLVSDSGALIYLDSICQLKQWQAMFPEHPAGIRCNLGKMVKPKKTHASYFIGEESRLGFTPEEITQLAGSQTIIGLHLYVGTDILDYDYFFECYRALLSFAKLFPNLSYVNLGGGFGIDVNGKFPFDIETYGDRLTALLEEESVKLGRKIRLLLEPGRIIGAESGYFACNVTDVKIRKNTQLVGVNASTTQFPRPLLYPDSAFHPIAVLRNGFIANGKQVVSNVYGCSTYSRDYFVRKKNIPKTEIGDWVVFGNSGSYCASAHTQFLGFLKAEEIFL